VSQLQFRMLGPLEVERGGDPIALAGRQQRVLLALLLIHANEPVTADRLVEEMWGEPTPVRALKRLQLAVTRLRKTLGVGVAPAPLPLETIAGGYRLTIGRSDLDVDVFRAQVQEGRLALETGEPARAAEILRAGLCLWRGPPLADVAYEPFAAPVVRELDELRLDALELAIDGDLGAGRHRAVVAEIEALVAEHPLRERLHGQLMVALYRCGRQSEALEAFRTARRRLVSELGIEPSHELRHLETEILAQSPALEPPASHGWRAAPPPVAAALRAEAGKPLVGRDAQRTQLAASWDAAIGGGQRTVLLTGEAGIGKTRLAAEAARTVSDSGHVALYGACDEALVVPGRPLALALRDYLGACDAATLRDRLGVYTDALARLLPEVAGRLPEHPRAPPADPATEQIRLLDGVAHVLRQASAASPLVLILDDLHWADELTLLALRHLVRMADAPGLLTIGTYRDAEPWRSALLADVIADATRRPDVMRLGLGALTAADVAALVDRDGGKPSALSSEVHAATDGNPFFVGELVRSLGDDDSRRTLPEVPAGVRDVLRARLARMPPATGTILATAALLGREFKAEVLLDVCGDRDAVLEALEHAERARIVLPVPGGFSFSHAIVVSAFADELPAARRLHVHELIALSLVARQPTHPVPAAELALHFGRAVVLGHAAEAVRWARAAGDEAMARVAFQAAAGHYADALEAHRLLGDASAENPLDLRVAHGRALRLAGALEAVGILLETAQAAEAAGDAELMAEALLALNVAYPSEVAAHTELLGLLERALELLNGEGGEVRARLMSDLVLESQNAMDQEDREELARKALAMARRSESPRALARALIACEWVAMHPAAVAERLAFADQLVAIASSHGLPYEECMGHVFRFAGSIEVGDAQHALEALDAAARTPGQTQGQWMIAFHRAAWTLLTGRLDQAEQEAIAAVEIGHAAGIDQSILLSGSTGQLACVRILQGRLSELEAPLLELAAAQPYLPAWHAALAKLRCDQGRLDEARTAFAETMRLAAIKSPRHETWSSALVLLSDVVGVLDERVAAQELFAMLRPFGGMMTWNTTCTFGPFDLALGRLAVATGDRDEAERRLRAAIALCERMGAEAFLAVARHELAAIVPDPEQCRLHASARADAERLGVALLGH
jgi:DNA-binding SARP family transcriptional activator